MTHEGRYRGGPTEFCESWHTTAAIYLVRKKFNPVEDCAEGVPWGGPRRMLQQVGFCGRRYRGGTTEYCETWAPVGGGAEAGPPNAARRGILLEAVTRRDHRMLRNVGSLGHDCQCQEEINPVEDCTEVVPRRDHTICCKMWDLGGGGNDVVLGRDHRMLQNAGWL